MTLSKRYFIEVDSISRGEKGQSVCGDVYLQRRGGGRTVLVLSDGAGHGVKANVIASVISSMAVNYTLRNEPVIRAARSIIETFAQGEKRNDAAPATFSIIDINDSGLVKVVEYGSPQFILMRNGEYTDMDRQVLYFQINQSFVLPLYVTEFEAKAEDRLVVFTGGVSMSGVGTKRLPKGWGRQGVIDLLATAIARDPQISAYRLSREVVGRAETNDLYVVKNDMSALAVYFRQPRKMLICTGPPFSEKRDAELADTVDKFDGTKILCGGTTAQIISRELGRDISVNLDRDPSGLPPTSSMEGIDLITEGVLTLGRLKGLLERMQGTDVTGKGTDVRLMKLFLEHDIIEFIVGTRINPIHQDPNLPIELELRRNVVKDIARLLEEKLMKEVSIRYI